MANGDILVLTGGHQSFSAATAVLSGLPRLAVSASDALFSSGTVVFTGLGAATVNTAAGSIRVSVPAGASATGNFGALSASNALFSSGTVVLSGSGGGVTVNTGAGTIVVSVAAPVAQTNQTVGLYALSQTTGGASSTTLDARTLSINAYGAISAGFSAGSIQISAPNTVAQTNQSIGYYVISQSTGASSSTTRDARSISFGGYGGVSIGFSGGTIQVSGPTTAAQTVQSLGMYALSNTTGGATSTTMDARTISINAYGAISAGYSAGSLQLSVPTVVVQTNQTLGLYAVSQSTGGASSTTVDARTLSIAGYGGVSVGFSAGTLQLSGANGGAAGGRSFVFFMGG